MAAAGHMTRQILGQLPGVACRSCGGDRNVKKSSGMNAPPRKLLKITFTMATVMGVAWLSGVRLFAFPGKSMEPAVMAGDYLVGLVGLWAVSLPERFDMVIFKVPLTSKWAERRIPWMKRVVGLPGERIRLSGERLFIDGREVKAPFLHRDREGKLSADFEITLKAEEYFVLGDNLDHSFEDSRVLGPISKSLLRGRVAFVIHRAKPKRRTRRHIQCRGSVTPRAFLTDNGSETVGLPIAVPHAARQLSSWLLWEKYSQALMGSRPSTTLCAVTIILIKKPGTISG